MRSSRPKHHILDTFAAMISGSDLLRSRGVHVCPDLRRQESDDRGLEMSGPLEAAFVNGMLAHSDETDDSNEFSQSHPGCRRRSGHAGGRGKIWHRRRAFCAP